MLNKMPMISWRWYCSLFKPPSDAMRQRWEKVKVRGKKNFVIRVGVLRYGGIMFVVMTAGEFIRKPPYPHQMFGYGFEIAINLVIWSIAGYVFGRFMWRFYETYFGREAGGTSRSLPQPPVV